MITFQVPDMTCGHCASSIAKAIAEVDRDARVEFELRSHQVRVTPSAASGADIQSAIEAAGYTPAPAEAATPIRSRAHRGCGCGCGSNSTLDMGQATPPASAGCCG
jgi:copper chaperone